jgi:hypothetical protein
MAVPMEADNFFKPLNDADELSNRDKKIIAH